MKRKWNTSFAVGLVVATLVGCDTGRVASITPDMARAFEVRQGFAGGATGAAGDAEVAGPEPAGWATLRGTFLIDGTPPTRAPLTAATSKDAEVCAPGGMAPLSEQLVVSETGGIKDVVIFLASEIADDEPWTHADAKPGKTDEIVFDQKQCVFLSHVIGMQVSQPLKILNSDPMGHNTNIAPTSNAAFNQNIPAGGSAIYQPNKGENSPAPIACSVHPWMNSFLLIRRNSYWAVSKADGSFEIPNLPAGVELEFRVWQEAANFVQAVALNGKDAKWAKGRFTLTLDPADESKNDMQVVVRQTSFKK